MSHQPGSTFPGRHPAKGLAANEVEDHEYNNHQHNDADDPDTSKSSDHKSSFSDAGLPGRGGAQSLHLQREKHTCLTPGNREGCRARIRHRMSEREDQSGDREIGTWDPPQMAVACH
jgi:hypothetical protein